MKTTFIISILFFFSMTTHSQLITRSNVKIISSDIADGSFKEIHISHISNGLLNTNIGSIGIIKTNDKYLLYSFVYKRGWSFVDRIIIEINNKTFQFYSDKKSEGIVYNDVITEENWYEPSLEFINELKNVETLKFTIYGEGEYNTYTIKEKKLNIINDYFNLKN